MEIQDLIDDERALSHLMELLSVEGLSGTEGAVAARVRALLLAAGCREQWVRFDSANERIPLDYEVGNLIVTLPGTEEAPRRLFMGHLDTVPLCRGAEPVRRDGRIHSAGATALGADNRTAVGALVTMIEAILLHQLPHPPLTFLFTVGEEDGLWGARYVQVADLEDPVMGFNIDSDAPEQLVIGAVGADRWEVEVHGRGSHAGVNPQDGVSALLIASRAIHEVGERGFFGAVEKEEGSGTSNVGILRGGEATNQVADHVYVKGESRSFDAAFVDRITGAYREAFERAATEVTAADGTPGRIDFRSETDYRAFRLADDAPVVQFSQRVIRSVGREPRLCTTTGGMDANYLVEHGVPTVTFGAGQYNPHTIEEYVEISDYLAGCRIGLALATAPDP